MNDPILLRVRIPGVPCAADHVARAFPALHVSHASGDEPEVDLAAWSEPSFDPRRLDPVVEGELGAGQVGLVLDPAGLPESAVAGAALQVVTRYQRFVRVRNEASRGPAFDRALAALRGMHDREEPLVAADVAHALDTWQWVRGAVLAGKVLDLCGIAPAECAAAARLIAGHEDPPADRDGTTLADADALSFFSLNSPGFVDHYGPAHARRKLAHTLARMSPGSVDLLDGIRLRRDVALLLEEARAAA